MRRILAVCFVIAVAAGCGSSSPPARFIPPSEIATFRAAGLHPLVFLGDAERPAGLARGYGFNNSHGYPIAGLFFFRDAAQAASFVKNGTFVGPALQNDSAVLVLEHNSAQQPYVNATKETRSMLLRIFRKLRPRG